MNRADAVDTAENSRAGGRRCTGQHSGIPLAGAAGRPFTVSPGGGGTVSWVHAEDAAQPPATAIERGRAGESYSYSVVDDLPPLLRDHRAGTRT
ncbi:hypothetical protein SCWH03_41700 [Streptomyces pacificus]|uniref:Uncharacterized protein n=1 Tax=Streptomyces pacificus TaxID=2705029 RepID=A0A6A0AYA5_9ACTN|nr:hypothetical protein SCWH03_41700 [Streptomyces pacificus]